MYIEKIVLNNIRSHTHSSITFSDGVNLIFGDVGKGKSSIFYALEFALFGSRPQTLLFTSKNEDLLSVNADSGYVEVTFLIFDRYGKEQRYKVCRGLKRRSKGVESWDAQTYIVYPDGRRAKKTARELTEAVVRLGFLEKGGSKKSTDVFTMGIYSRQEMMKEILLPHSDTRKDTLRRVFDILAYKNIQNNITLLAREYRRSASFAREIQERIDDIQRRLYEETQMKKELENKLASGKSAVAELDTRYSDLEKQVNQLEEAKDKITKLDAQRASMLDSLKRLKESINSYRLEIEAYKKELSRADELKARENKYRELVQRQSNLEKEIASLRPKKDRYIDLKSTIESTSRAISELEESISQEDYLKKQYIETTPDEANLERKRIELQDAVMALKQYKAYVKRKRELENKLNTRKALEDELSALDKKKKELHHSRSELDQLREKIASLDKNASTLAERRNTLTREYARLVEEKKDLEELSGRSVCPKCGQELDKTHMTRLLSDLDTALKENQTGIDELNRRLEDTTATLSNLRLREKEITEALFDEKNIIARHASVLKELEHLKELDNELKALENEYGSHTEEELKKIVGALNTEINDLMEKQKKANEIKAALNTIEENKVRLSKFRTELTEATSVLNELEGSVRHLNDLETEMTNTRNGIESLKKDHEDYIVLVQKQKDMETLTEKLEKEIARQKDMENKMKDMEEKLRELKDSYSRDIYEASRNELAEVKGKRDMIMGELTQMEERIKDSVTRINTLKRDISNEKKSLKKHMFKTELAQWLDNVLKPAVIEMEAAAFRTRRAELNTLFQEYFEALIPADQDLSVEISREPDDAFAPVVYRGDSTATLSSLSGGESAAVALAYRLAVNQLLGYYYEPLKRGNLIILDEPTDNFSKEQIERFKDLIVKLNLSQIIIITHEKTEFENIGENIIEITRGDDGSRVSE